ncbi:neural-cadherin [Plakobranchus ocellatus]|uniref:Neural-cadherin n=1 Tax=Plakobranchus ocellatus TaxID=259542 RepID=A0AAV4E299_9GAST|nr:neural-cadherin [Plakobranchus ocellatus]
MTPSTRWVSHISSFQKTMNNELHLTKLLVLMFLASTTISIAGASASVPRLLSRTRRAVSSVTIGEDATTDETLFDLNDQDGAKPLASFNFAILNATGVSSTIFRIDDNKLKLSPAASDAELDTFDREAVSMIEVNIEATKRIDPNAGQKIVITVEITLTDVNDVPPVITNPLPYQAVVAPDADPGTVIYTVTAFDADLNPSLVFTLEPGSDARFGLQPTGSSNTINIVTIGANQFDENQSPLQIQVSVEDENGISEQKITRTIQVTVGTLPPQFYANSFEGQLYEESADQMVQIKDGSDSLVIRVIQFQPNENLRFEVLDSRFEIVPDAAVATQIMLRAKDEIDYETTRTVTVTVRVTEDGTGYQSEAQVRISVIDTNDSPPKFVGNSQYFVQVSEDQMAGSVVFQVSATDEDSDRNGEIIFSVEGTDAFEVETVAPTGGREIYTGNVLVKSENELDYEAIKKIEFTIVATDGNLVSPKSSSVLVSVTITNVNDNEPTIDNSTRITVPSSAKQNYVVTILGASDVDGDNIRFYFEGPSPRSGIFQIEEQSGKISLIQDVPSSQDKFDLRIVAVDDGSCCTPEVIQSSTTLLTITVEDANLNKPDFVNCSTYNNAEVLEKAAIGTQVVQVSAQDLDRGQNSKVTYRFQTDTIARVSPFDIDPDTGWITVLNNDDIVRQRGRDPYIQVTVIGANADSLLQLEGYCTFRISIIDINDHPPTFEKTAYEFGFLLSSGTPAIIARMQATDDDFGANANITYSLGAGAPDFFTIDRLSGTIILQSSDQIQPRIYFLSVIANDNGIRNSPLTGSTNVNIDVKSGSFILPSWVNAPSDNSLTLSFREDTDIDTVLYTLQCQSNSADNPNVEFRVFDTTKSINDDSEFFSATMREPNQGSVIYSLDITLIKRFSYLVQSQHLVTATCQGFTGSNLRAPDIVIRVNVEDTNNQKPLLQGMSPVSGRFTASVPENAASGTSVRTVEVVDKDENASFKDITFELRAQDSSLFTIEKIGNFEALVRTAAVFDREVRFQYNFQIVASDGLNKDERFMAVTVTDINDKVPVFDKPRYEFNVSETAEINDPIGEVTATDEDSIDQGIGLEYQFSQGNINSAFTIIRGSGQIRSVRKLDFDSNNEPKTYTLTLVAYDNERVHSASTLVIINVLDENDNPPIFNQNVYEVRNLVEEEDSSITSAKPKLLVTVSASDKDLQRTQTKITYDLAAPNSLFTVDSNNGSVYLIGTLDRDGPVQETRVTIRAGDEPNDPLYAYADVVVFPIDINDNAPVFDQSLISFSVKEHAPRGASVGTVLARDIDAGANAQVKYRLAVQQPSAQASYFSIEEGGTLRTNVDPDALDYEQFTSVQIVVEAYDQGSKPESTSQIVTVTLEDINDQKPYFDKQLYTARMSEATTSGEILRILAKDEDTAPQHRLFEFSIEPSTYFQVSGSEDYAVISVNPSATIDYEMGLRLLNFTLSVQDGTASDHTASTEVQITVEDYNDETPQITPRLSEQTLLEGEPKGAVIATFSAVDRDSGINAEFEFSIQRESDPYFEFYIEPQAGNVTTRKVLDRELAPERNVIIYAIDKGEIPLTGSATLKLTLTDINDNAPMFAEDYRPVLPENEDNNNRLVVEIFAVDPDTRQYGPPFGFALPTGCSTPACREFSLQYNENGANGNGTATIRTSTRFDREERKEYLLPIVIWDMNDGTNSPDSQTATSTLTVVIGDKNDNKHSAGHQEITFYNFDGKFGDVEIGRVYAEDADDWDLPDKTFTYVSPPLYQNYFSVDGESGIITIKRGVPASDRDKPYEFEVDVYDKVYQNTARCTVAVTVFDLPDEALRKAGSMRLKGITAEEFIAPGGPSVPGQEPPPSKMHKFKVEMARLLQYPGPDNIEVVGLTDGPGYLDLRFSGHASPYLTPAQMESTVMLNLNSIQKAADITIDQVPVNLCMEEKYYIGCYTDVQVSVNPRVINANGSSFTTVDVASKAIDGCPSKTFPTPVACSGAYCYNGGTCQQDNWGKLSCNCREGFDGPRCQQRRHSFNGNSIAFYEGLSPCTQGRTSIELITLEPDGLIMFNGPVVDIDPTKNAQNFILLELKNGYPQLRLNLGVGEVLLALNGTNRQGQVKMPALNDGQWHRIDIDREFQDVTLTVDHCQYADNDNNGTVTDWTPCLIEGRVPGGDVLLNVQSLLQVGGRYPLDPFPVFPSGIPNKGFNGCLRNLVHNSKLYDLFYKPIENWNSGQNGCPREEGICGEGTSSPSCGTRATCQSFWKDDSVQSCSCHPGWYGNKCSTEAPTMDFKDNSFFHWRLSQDQLQNAERHASIQLMFRSRQETGTLFALTNAAQKKIDLQLEDRNLVLRYDMGDGEQALILNETVAADGAWHVARMERFGSEFQMTIDGGEGRSYTFRPIIQDVDVLFNALSFISAGARVPTVASPTLSQISNDLIDTCIRDIRFNDQWLPMALDQNNQANPGLELLQAPNIVEDCNRNDCDGVTCENDRFCFPLWGDHECRCLKGTRPDPNGICVSACEPNPCFNNVPCTLEAGEIKCQCPEDFIGQFCNIGLVSEESDGLSAGAIAGIVIAILVVLVLIIILIIFITTCRREDSEKNVLEVDPDDDFIRENVMFYDEEGAGEEDHEAYDITLLQKMNSETNNMPNMNPVKEDDMSRRNEPRLDRPDVGSFIDSRIRDTENDDDPFKDVPLEFNYEGGNSDAGSLSSLNTSSSGGSQDYDYLNDWGPKFARLADMYGAGQNLES